MFKKALAIGALAVLAIFSVPTAANAAAYGDGGDNGATVVVTPGAPVTFSFGGFQPGEQTVASAPDAVTLSALKVVVTASKPAGPNGTVSYTASATQPGSYTITVSSATNVATGTLTVVPTDAAGSGTGSGSNGSLPNTGFETPMLIVWGAGGALVLGIALVFVLSVVRRNKSAA
ncbi:LPXTG cell wall anchor domain-containing protein [Agreia sp. VKM Ac-1783]|uniref:LPXTG cell wall anchor domain-containing protein n=1 Tax=Agreia sp. VKM Ac-1783 TaxID=1938889 RepID=UPI000A2ACCFE|nr:LPXTG cell wall anchor domain-containing protein [Agreia sp. VKM Ac-1783]SMQ58527.1 LPXTG-motif cell wall anchor domain-containing protein [Agreia sp. VKM Ac-1783]